MFINRKNIKKQENAKCTECGNDIFIYGPSGGCAQNLLCNECGMEFNVVLDMLEPMGRDFQRAKDIYQVDLAKLKIVPESNYSKKYKGMSCLEIKYAQRPWYIKFRDLLKGGI